MTPAQVKHMVDRFLQWKLPRDFAPDDGITFTRTSHQIAGDYMPSGTNVFDARQAEAMVRFMIDGLPKD